MADPTQADSAPVSQDAPNPNNEAIGGVAPAPSYNPADQTTRDVGDIFEQGLPDMHTIFATPNGPNGTGGEETDRYAATLLTLPQLINSDGPILDSIRANQAQIQATPQEELMNNLRGVARNVLTGTRDSYVRDMQNVYAITPNKQIVADAKANTAQMNQALNMGGTSDQLAVNLSYAVKGAKNLSTAEAIKNVGKTLVFDRFMEENFPKGIWTAAKSWTSAFFLPTGVRNLVHGFMPGTQVAMARAFQNKLPAEQLKALPGILRYLKSISDNPEIFKTNAEPFLNTEDINTVYRTLALDAVGTASWIPFTKVARLVRVASTPAFIAREAGAVDQAGKIVAETQMDTTEQAAKAAGQTRLDATASSLPFGGENLNPEILDKVNVAAQKTIEKNLSPLHKILNRLVSGADVDYHLIGSMDKKDIDAFQENLLRTHAGEVKVIKQDQFGVSYQVTLEKEAPEQPVHVSAAAAEYSSEQDLNQSLKTQLNEARHTNLSQVGPRGDKAQMVWTSPPVSVNDVKRLEQQVLESNIRLSAKRASVELAARGSEAAAPPVAKGSVRYYHGGTVGSEKIPRWVTSHLEDAKGWASRHPDMKVHYVDLPADHPQLGHPEDLAQGILPNSRFELNAADASRLRPLAAKNMVKETTVKYVRFQQNNIGKFDALEYHATPFISSADTVMNQIHNIGEDYAHKLVTQATLIGRQQEHILDMWRQAIQPVFKGITKSESKELSSLLEHGNLTNTDRFSSADLLTGVTTKDGVIRLKTGEQLARYHSLRDIMKAHHMTNDAIFKRELQFKGYTKAFDMNTVRGKLLNFVNPDKALKELPSHIREIYDTRVGKVIEVLDRGNIHKLIDEGQIELHEAHYPIQHETDASVTHVISGKGDMRELPDSVLGYKPGYFGPLMYKNIFHIVTKEGRAKVDGVERTVRHVDRAFSSREEAKAYIAHPDNAGKTMEIVPSKEFTDPTSQRLDANLKNEYQSKVHGGFTTSQRNEEQLRFGLAGTPAETRSALEAMEAAIGNVSERMPMNDFKLGLIQRFLNSAERPVSAEAAARGEKGVSYLGDKNDWTSPINDVGPKGKALRAAQEWMKSIFHVQTQEERKFQRIMYDVGSFFDGKNLNRWTGGMARHLSNWSMNLGSQDAYSLARTLSFHALLGWFNPRQLWVQAAGAIAAFSVNPERAFVILPRYMAMRAMLHDNAMITGDMVHGAISRATSFMNKVQWEDTVRAYMRSGIKESVRTSADYDAAIKGFGMTRKALNRAADRGLYFLREGETLNRTYNWLWGHMNIMKGKPAGYRLTLEDERAITAESLRIGTNLMKENRAGFQRGAWSIPLQYQQVSTKFLGNMIHAFGGGIKSGKSNWTKWEATKIGLGQAALFGAAGVPFGKYVADEMANWLKDDGDYGLAIKDPEKITAITGGFTDWMLDKATGTNSTVSGSMSYAGNLGEMAQNLIGIDGHFAHAIGGAFSSVGDRTVEAAGAMAQVLATSYEARDIDEHDLWDIANKAGSVLSSWRQVDQALAWEQSKLITNSRGQVMRSLDPEKDLPMLLLKALGGIAPSDIQQWHDLNQAVADHEKSLKDAADGMLKLALDHFNDPYYNTQKGIDKTGAAIDILLHGFSHADQQTIVGIARIKIREKDDQYAKTLLSTIKLMRDTEGKTPALEFNSLLADPKPDQSEK